MLQLMRIFQAGTRNFMRNLWLTTAATAVMTITLMIVIISFISNSALTNTIKNYTDKIDVSLYLRDDITPDQLAALQAKISANPNTASLTYTSKDEALVAFRKLHEADENLLAATGAGTDNPLPASLQIGAKDPKKLDSFTTLAKEPEVASLLDAKTPVSYTGDKKARIDKIIGFSNFTMNAGLLFSFVFVAISVLIIFNTIRMAIFTRRDEIEIMKLVGATKSFIRGPFVFESALYGVLAAIIATSLSYAALFIGGPKIRDYIDLSTAVYWFSNYPLGVLLGAILIGVIIGMFSSLLAMARYLKL